MADSEAGRRKIKPTSQERERERKDFYWLSCTIGEGDHHTGFRPHRRLLVLKPIRRRGRVRPEASALGGPTMDVIGKPPALLPGQSCLQLLDHHELELPSRGVHILHDMLW